MTDSTPHLEYYRSLANKWAGGIITEAELKELEAWYNAGMDQELLVKLPLNFTDNEARLKAEILHAISEGTGIERHVSGRPAIYHGLARWAAAAAVLLLLGAGFYFIFYSKTGGEELAVDHYHVLHDIKAPSASRATITLAGGQRIYLDSAANGQLAVQNQVSVVKIANGQVSYRPAGDDPRSDEVEYNTLTNPRGSKVINITLADGSRVWLNTASSVTYPVAFTGHAREVSVTGEAYFEVVHDAQRPFTVSKGNMEIKVLGTRFNVNSYEDDGRARVTLMEGSVAVVLRRSGANKKQLLKPGEQAVVSRAGQISLIREADTEGALAWKNGYFLFDREPLGDIMQQVSRWYDVEVQYRDAGLKDQLFSGTVSRFKNVSKLLEKLALTGAFHFDIQGKEILVTK